MEVTATQRKVSPALRKQVLGERPTCYWCGYAGACVEFDADHLVPYSAGGLTIASNLVAACSACNRSRQAKSAAEADRWVARSKWIRLTAEQQEAETLNAMRAVAAMRKSRVM